MFGQDLSDANLFRRVRRGDTRAAVVLLRRHDLTYRRLVSRLLADPAQVNPVLHKAYMKAWRGASMAQVGRGKDAVATWLYRTVYNVCVDELRRQPPLPDPEPSDGPRPRLHRASEGRRMAGLRALPPAERTVLVLVDSEGFEIDEAARIMQREPALVARTLEQARRHWRDLVIGPPSRADAKTPSDPDDSPAEPSETTSGPSDDPAGTNDDDATTQAEAGSEGNPDHRPEDGTADSPDEPRDRKPAPTTRISPDIGQPDELVPAPEGAFDETRFARLKHWFKTGGGPLEDEQGRKEGSQ